MYDDTTIGARLRTLRRWRGMTLAQLADQAGLSQSYLSMAERGQRTLDRRSYIAALAAALTVSETDLVGGPHLSADPIQSEPHATIPHIRAALLSNTLTAPATDRARPLHELTAEMARLERSRLKFRQAGAILPPLIDELHVHAASPADERAQRLALETLIEAFQTATFITKDLGYDDLAALAALRATEIAGILDDPVSTGKAASLRIHTMPTTSWRVRLNAAEAAADTLQPHVHESSVPVLGMLTLVAALSATVAANPSQADHWLSESTELAARIPDTPADNWGAFSTTNVGVWRIALAVEQGESGGGARTRARRRREQADRPARAARVVPGRRRPWPGSGAA